MTLYIPKWFTLLSHLCLVLKMVIKTLLSSFCSQINRNIPKETTLSEIVQLVKNQVRLKTRLLDLWPQSLGLLFIIKEGKITLVSTTVQDRVFLRVWKNTVMIYRIWSVPHNAYTSSLSYSIANVLSKPSYYCKWVLFPFIPLQNRVRCKVKYKLRTKNSKTILPVLSTYRTYSSLKKVIWGNL